VRKAFYSPIELSIVLDKDFFAQGKVYFEPVLQDKPEYLISTLRMKESIISVQNEQVGQAKWTNNKEVEKISLYNSFVDYDEGSLACAIIGEFDDFVELQVKTINKEDRIYEITPKEEGATIPLNLTHFIEIGVTGQDCADAYFKKSYRVTNILSQTDNQILAKVGRTKDTAFPINITLISKNSVWISYGND